jgi:hypothetical protein
MAADTSPAPRWRVLGDELEGWEREDTTGTQPAWLGGARRKGK